MRMPLPLAQWFETVHSNDILSHLDEMKGVITFTYGRILKMDSTKKITKNLAGGIGDSAAWMSNIGNEFGQVLNSVLTSGEVRLDSLHFMRRFNCGLTTEHHPLYGIFCAKLSSCIFAWDQEDVQRLKEAKRAEWKSSHSGHTPTEEQLMATISPGKLKRHCRRRTRGVEEMRGMISGLLESVWELTDTTGLRLCSRSTWSAPKTLQVLHCTRRWGHSRRAAKSWTSSLESFHRHQYAFIPGWRCNAVHTQMYMLERVSRWNMGRAKEAVDVEGASTLRSFDVRLMSHLSNLSQRVLGSTLVPEFTPPGKPTSERIAVEYLLSQTNKSAAIGAGDPPGAVEGDAEPGPLVTLVLEAEEEPDDTISMTNHTGDPPRAVEGDDEPGPLVTETSQCDSRGVVGWDAVDNLAGYLVGLDRTITALSLKEEADIVQLYTALHDMDKKHSSYTQKARKKGQASGGPWRAPRRPSGSAPGQQAAERLYMTHGQAAQDPEHHRVSECVCLRLAKEFEQSRNRPKDTRGKTLPIPQSIVSIYSHIRQLLEDSRVIVVQTALALVPVNNTTVSAWLLRRDKRKDRNMLLQGNVLPQQLYLAKDPLPSINTLPAAPVQLAHEDGHLR
ncbi:unnamed protein product [Boreogadus saida]